MKADGIKSPDISDTCCFCFLVDYIPADTGQTRQTQTSEWRKLIAAMDGEEG